uniref:(California timema) hypothetical protein n=1 Tax=Timema californicum TaxID=61474 RepID=A0A7R9J683_TIMCA|nr:unnamed protein product [Timema californicum]
MAGNVNFYLDESEVGSIRSRNSSIVPGNHYEVITRMEELRYAVLSEQVNVVRTLLKKVTERELHEYSEMANSFPIRRPLLHIAVLKKCPVILKLLLDKRIFQILINERDAEYYTPLMRAADVGSGECVRLLMDAGANTTLSVFKSPDDRHRSNQTSKFVRRRNNTATSSGTTATHIAAEGGYVDVLSLLVQKLDVRQGLEDPDSLGRTPLMVAVENGHVGCFNLLVSVGARYVDVVDYKYQTVLHLSAKKGKTEMLRELLRKPEVRKMVNDRDKQSFTALSWSVYNGNVDCMDELLDAGADQKVKDENNNTLLHLACFQGHSHVLKELLPYSLRFMKSTPQREETASLKKNPSSFSSMLTSHEDILNLRNHTRPSGRTVYWWYMRDLKQRNKQGSNCFHLASTSGDVKCLELLLSCFASPGHTDLGEIVCPDIREVDGYGLTPLYISARAGSAECVKFLIDYGGNLAFSSPVDSHNVIGASQEKVLDVLFQNVDNFDQLISEVLDECVDISTDIGSERKFILDLSVLCPEGVNKMAVTKLLYEQNRTPSLKEHPLILAFIQLEWYPQKFVLWYRFVNYILFLACFSWYVAHPNLNESTDPIRWTLMPLTILVFMFVAPILLPGNGSMIFRSPSLVRPPPPTPNSTVKIFVLTGVCAQGHATTIELQTIGSPASSNAMVWYLINGWRVLLLTPREAFETAGGTSMMQESCHDDFLSSRLSYRRGPPRHTAPDVPQLVLSRGRNPLLMPGARNVWCVVCGRNVWWVGNWKLLGGGAICWVVRNDDEAEPEPMPSFLETSNAFETVRGFVYGHDIT